ncbi:putative ribonuclease H protein [Vitis vinifera]|uniref:Putative ribonuclease H protein n=1 Tax=Vitis vinifera TaxID=29760 RepID=A0A438CVW2_VITVI|nr:putative ribonuclease H protein [Vitis vinifera]
MGWKADIGRLQFDQISQQEAENLEMPFSEDEIYVALMEMNEDKAPGPDGFTMAFCKVVGMLIPKKCGAENLGDFRPISLLGVSSLALKVLDKEILSPYLFIMGMEVLDVLIRRAVEGGFLSGSASGLRINLAKSEIISIGEVVEMEELAVELGCRVGSLPSQYLGLPLGAPNRAPYIWDGVEERVRRRLALWKRQYISKGKRVTLIKSTLASMSIYQMSIFRMPKVVRRIEKVQRDFLWGEGNMEGKIHLVKWEMVCTDKDKGGLGLRKLALLNKALLGKWIWRYACDKDNLWKQVIKVKYGQEGLDWRPKKANGAIGIGVWKEILKESKWCWDNMRFRVGKDNMIRFWTDVWCSESSLSQCFPHLYGMTAQRNSTIEEMWDQNSDSVLWRQGRSGQFRVKEAYSLLMKSDDIGFPSRSIWVARVPTKVAFFAWETTWERCLLWIDFKEEDYNFQIVVSCVDVRKKV